MSKRSFLEAVASSLTEMFSRDLISLRMDKMREHYPWLSAGLAYFEGRLSQAPEDAEFALAWVIRHARTRAEQELAIGALQAKCDILWAQLDSLYFAYVQPGWPAPGAFCPEPRGSMTVAINPDSRPQLRAGCRFSEAAGQENVLLIPEGLMKLVGPGRRILELCDGHHTFAQILAALQSVYTDAPPQQMEQDTASYLERLRERGAVQF